MMTTKKMLGMLPILAGTILIGSLAQANDAITVDLGDGVPGRVAVGANIPVGGPMPSGAGGRFIPGGAAGAGAWGGVSGAQMRTAPGGIDLNEFVLALAEKAGLTYVANPTVTGEVNGTFSTDNPIEAIRLAARANGYLMRIEGDTVELENKDTLGALPQQMYTRRLNYLRAAYVREPGTEKTSFDAQSSGVSEIGGGSSSSFKSSGKNDGTAPSAVEGSQAERIEKLFAGVLSDKAYLRFDIKTSTLVARDNERNIAALDALINELDVPRPNIYVEIEMVELTDDEARLRGVNWASTLGGSGMSLGGVFNLNDTILSAISGGLNVSSLLPGKGGSVSYLGGDGRSNMTSPGWVFDSVRVSAVVKYLNTSGLAQTKARLSVVTEDNESATAKVTTMTPTFQQGASGETYNGGMEINYVAAGDKVRLTPQLRPGGLVRLLVAPEFSNIIGSKSVTVQGGGVNEAPVIYSRTQELYLSMPLGKTMIIGGLLEDKISEDGTKVPLLGDIPFFGNLFRSKEQQRQQRKMVLFVTPRLLDPSMPDQMDREVSGLVNSYQHNPANGDRSASLMNIDSNAEPRWGAEARKDATNSFSPIAPPLRPTDAAY